MRFILPLIQSTVASQSSYFLATLKRLDWQTLLESFWESAKPALRTAGTTVLILSLVSITGCGGCQSKEEKEAQAKKEKLEKKKKDKEKKKKPKPDFESMPPIALPGILNDPVKMKRRATLLRNDPMQKEIDKLRSTSIRKNYAKPGHWQDIRFQANANHYDIEGELYAGAVPGGATNRFLPVEGTKYTPVTERLAALPKGKWKTFDSSMFIPLREESSATTSVRCGFNRANGTATNFLDFNSLRSMSPDQHHLVLLTDRQDVFKYLEFKPSIKMPGSDANNRPNRTSYIIISSDPQFPVPLPRHALYWSTIAYLIWDDLDPDRLDLDQQTAMIDWLHFGGQLILSGPDCVQRLEKSFLADYLPARTDKAVNLTSGDLATLNSRWSLPEKNARGKNRDLQVLAQTPLLGVNFQLHDDAKFIEGSGDLVVERQLGRGRIVATSFSLAAPEVRSWRSFDSFFNNVLLRRPARTFFEPRDSFGEAASFRWRNDRAPMREPLLHSSVRFLARDLAKRGTAPDSSLASWEEMKTEEELMEDSDTSATTFGFGNDPGYVPAAQTGIRDLSDLWHYGGYDFDPQSGIGGWSDFDAVAGAARSTLQEAAGITPPSGNFVLKLLAGYLFVLVPLNWLIFWMIGKVEYAWIAAPIIAVAGGLIVIRMASLDIGFSRSNTQVALLEIPAEYERGHLTEYSALYTSLSTAYRVELDGDGGLALPFPSNRSKTFRPSEQVPLILDKTVANTMSGVQIQSNTTELIHAENLFDTGGRIRLKIDDSGEMTLINGTNLTFKNVLIAGGLKQSLRAESTSKKSNGLNKEAIEFKPVDPTPAAKLAMIESIPPNSQVKITFGDTQKLINDYRRLPLMINAKRTAEQLWVDKFARLRSVTVEQLADLPELKAKWPQYLNWFSLRLQEAGESEVDRSVFVAAYEQFNPSNAVSLGRMFDCVFENLKLGENEYRMFASTNEKLGQTKIDPSSTQTDRQTLVVAHLSHPSLPKISRDANSADDLKIQSNVDDEKQQKTIDLFE